MRLNGLREQTTLAYRGGLLQNFARQDRKLEEVVACFSGFELQKNVSTSNVYDVELNASQSALQEWLSPVPALDRLMQHASEKECSNGSCFLSSGLFKTWEQSGGASMWIHGPPGIGKTILSTSIIEHLQNSTGPLDKIAYFFFDFLDSEGNTLHRMAATLIYQLVPSVAAMPPGLRRSFDNAGRLRHPHVSEVQALDGLREVIEHSRCNISLVLDGLDESTEASKIAAFVTQLTRISHGGIRSVVLSRHTPEIKSMLQAFTSAELDAESLRKDIHEYLLLSVPSLLVDYEQRERNRIVTRLNEGAGGMFLWARLMVDRLRSALCPIDVVNILEQPLSDIDEMYAKPLHQLSRRSPAERSLARRLIQWVCLCRRPLTVSELEGAMAICSERETFDNARRPFNFVTWRLCSTFFHLESRSQTVRPFHASVKDFLVRSPLSASASLNNELIVSESQSHQDITIECLIMLKAALGGYGGENPILLEPIARYACRFWLEHALECDFTPDTRRKVSGFLESACRERWIFHFLLWQRQEFPLQHLLRLRTGLLNKFAIEDSSTVPSYMDWDFDVAAALLALYRSRAIHNQSSERQMDELILTAEQFSHFEAMMIIRDIARHFTQTSKIAAAIGCFTQALDGELCSVSGPSNLPTLIFILNTLGILLDQTGETKRATAMQEQALNILNQNNSPKDHPQMIIWSKNELGRMYRHQKLFESAEMMHLAALQELTVLDTTTSGSADLEIAWTRSTLARVYRCQRRYKDAIMQTTAALEIRSQLLGHDHPHCVWLQSDIAQCHFEQGDYIPAIALHREVHEMRHRVLGPDHPDTLWSINNLGVALAMTGEEGAAEAFMLQRRALDGQERVLGREHSNTVWTRRIVDSARNS
jgi:tetratricopeptide (TPR) repeat protein